MLGYVSRVRTTTSLQSGRAQRRAERSTERNEHAQATADTHVASGEHGGGHRARTSHAERAGKEWPTKPAARGSSV